MGGHPEMEAEDDVKAECETEKRVMWLHKRSTIKFGEKISNVTGP